MTKGIDLSRRSDFDDIDAFDLTDSRNQFAVLPPHDRDDHDHDGDNHGHHHDTGNEPIFPLPYDALAFPDGVSSGDVTQTSAVLWTRAGFNGAVTFQVATDPRFHHVIDAVIVSVANTLVPAKVMVDNLHPDQRYYYRAVDASGHVAEGTLQTAAALGHYEGFSFGVGGDVIKCLIPHPNIQRDRNRTQTHRSQERLDKPIVIDKHKRNSVARSYPQTRQRIRHPVTTLVQLLESENDVVLENGWCCGLKLKRNIEQVPEIFW